MRALVPDRAAPQGVSLREVADPSRRRPIRRWSR